MSQILSKWIEKWWMLIASLLLTSVYIYGLSQMYFHQDDLDWFLMANQSLKDVIGAPIGDHVNYVFRILLKIEWSIFHFNFPGFFTVSIIMHAIVVLLLYKLSYLTTKRRDLSCIVALIFIVNMNWSETVLWISGQTITITAMFVLLSMIAIWEKKNQMIWMLLTSWTSALALGLPFATMLVYKDKKIRLAAILSVVLVILIYLWRGTDGTHIVVSLKWLIDVALVSGLMFVNSVLGRLIIPFDRFEMIRIGVTTLVMLLGLWKWRGKIKEVLGDGWSRFLIIQMVVYNLIVALGRAQYGVGIMRADRYAYLGLAIFLLLVARTLRKSTLGSWIWIVPILVISQSMGFYIKARAYVVRPQQLRELVGEIKKKNIDELDPGAYLPHFVLNDERLRYRDLMSLLND